MLPGKGSASEGSAVFSGDDLKECVFCEAALAQRPEANDKALRQNNYQESPSQENGLSKRLI